MSTFAIEEADVFRAARNLKGRIHRTPVFRSRLMDEDCGATLFFKGEHLQRSGSFKIRGAMNMLLNLPEATGKRGVVAYSSGNHAQALALAAREHAWPATIVMPSDAPQSKLDATLGYGAEVLTYDRVREDREAIAQRLAAEKGATVVPPFDHPLIMAGQGTVGLEFLEQVPDLDGLVVPVGGGGLLSGIAVIARALRPSIEIIGVEPARVGKAKRSMREGKIVRISQPKTIADGVATQALGEKTFPILHAMVSRIVSVEEDDIRRALHLIMTRMKQVVEPTGALATAALLSGAVQGRGRTFGVILCGGNLDWNDRRWMEKEPLLHE